MRSKWNGDFLKQKVRQAQYKACQAVAFHLEAKSKNLSPYDTGRLRASITTEVKEAIFKTTIKHGSNVEYAIYQEYGTNRMPAHPYLRPPLADTNSIIKQYKETFQSEMK